jgi:hypothetical protein
VWRSSVAFFVLGAHVVGDEIVIFFSLISARGGGSAGYVVLFFKMQTTNFFISTMTSNKFQNDRAWVKFRSLRPKSFCYVSVVQVVD